MYQRKKTYKWMLYEIPKNLSKYDTRVFNLMTTYNDIRNMHSMYSVFTITLKEFNSCISD